jgi:hypothetical protein
LILPSRFALSFGILSRFVLRSNHKKQNYDPLLSCSTQKTFLYLSGRFGSGPLHFLIRDDQGGWLGAVQPDEELRSPSQELRFADKKSWISYELVAIPRGYAYE